jgi:hypothetical protein
MTNELTNIKLAQNSVTSQLKNKPHVEYRLITSFFKLFLQRFYSNSYNFTFRDKSTEIEPLIEVLTILTITLKL